MREIASTTHRECRMPIRQENAHRVELLLAGSANQSSNPEQHRSKLQRLSEHSFCLPFHQYQVDKMEILYEDRWIKRMWEAFPRYDRVDERVDATSERVRQRPRYAFGKSPTAHYAAHLSNTASVIAPSASELAEQERTLETLRDYRRRNEGFEELDVRQACLLGWASRVLGRLGWRWWV